MAAGSTFTATIGRVNGSGFQIQERPGTWLNLSKYASPPPAIPEPGTVVRITLDGSGFVRGVEALEDAAQPALFTEKRTPLSSSITRLAVLKSAARFLAGKPDATQGELLELAARLEQWVERES